MTTPAHAALHQPRHQDRAGRRGARILAAVHHQHRAGRTILDRLALRMGAVAEHVDLVEILARRHVAQREGLADQRRLIGTERMHVLDHLDAKAALEQRGGDGGGGDGLQLVAGGVAEFGHGSIPLSSFRGGASASNPEARDSRVDASFGAPRNDGELVNRRLVDRRAEPGLEEIEVAAFIGLLDVAGEHPAIAALEARLAAASMRRGALPARPPAHRG